MSNYTRGRYFEYRCKTILEAQGYVVIRSPQSRGPADLVAMRDGEILFVQCKTGAGKLSADARAALIEMARQAGGKAMLARREGRGIVWEELGQ